MKNRNMNVLLSIKIAYIKSTMEINTSPKQRCWSLWITKCVDFSLQFYFHCADILSDNEVISITLACIHLHTIMGVYYHTHTHKHTVLLNAH